MQKSVRAPYPHPKCSAPLGAPGKGDGPGAGYLLGVGAVSRVAALQNRERSSEICRRTAACVANHQKELPKGSNFRVLGRLYL